MTVNRTRFNQCLSAWGWIIAAIVLLASSCGSDEPVAVEAGNEAAAEAKLVITPGRANWSTGYMQAAIYSALVEELGYTVIDPAVNEYPPSEAYIAMAEGDIDFWANGWYPQHDVWQDKTLADGTRVGDRLVVIGSQLKDAGLQGLVITKSIADDYDIRSLDQINDDPELVSLFDVDNNGLGDIFGCPEDWTCDNVIDEIIALNGWTNLEQITAGYPGMAEASLRRVAANEPAILYTWSPSGYLAQFVPGENVLWLSMGGASNVLDGSTESGVDYARFGPASLGASCSDDPCWPGWAVEDVLVTANRSFAESHPDIAMLFEVVVLDVNDIAEQNARYDAGEDSEQDLRRHVAEWLTGNRPLVDEWLDQARAAGG